MDAAAGNEVGGTPLENTQIYIDIDEFPPVAMVEKSAQPWCTLLSLSAGVSHIYLTPQGDSHGGIGVENKYCLGRSKKKCDFVFDDQRISSLHCSMYAMDVSVSGGVTSMVCIHDESANGTYVDSQKIKPGVKHVLRDGQEISLIKPEKNALLSEWDKARFIVKIPARASSEELINMSVQTDEGVAIRQRLGTISRLLAQDRRLTDHYQVIRPIGEGAHGQVHFAIDKTFGREWAVKYIDIRRASLSSGHGVATILKEAEIMKNLQHENIVNLEDVFADGTNIYIVMELLAGGDLFDRVVKKSKYQEAEALALMVQLLNAMAYLHAQGIAHRDLKLENIMLVNQISDVDIKITDFGLAKSGGGALKTFCGTPNYYAPEVLQRRHTVRGEGSYSVAADMWSCGVIMYILLSGEMPWRGRDIDKCIREGKFTPMIGAKWASISSDAKSLIRGLLQPDAAVRLTVEQALKHPWFTATASGDLSMCAVTTAPDLSTAMSVVVEPARGASEVTICTGISNHMDCIALNSISVPPSSTAAPSTTQRASVAKTDQRNSMAKSAKKRKISEANEEEEAPTKRRTIMQPRKCRTTTQK